MPACELKPPDKRAFIGSVGEELVKRHGKKKYYKTDEIRKAAADRGFPIDWVCWAYCIFSSPGDFKALHDSAGEACDYAAMKTQVLSELAGGAYQWPDIDASWLDWSDIDLPTIFGWVDWTP